MLDRQWLAGNSRYDAQRRKVLDEEHQVSHEGPYRPDFKSLNTYQVPEWYKNAKFGIFIHRRCVLGAGIWQRVVSPAGVHFRAAMSISTTSRPMARRKSFGYKDFIPMFKAEKFDPQAWAHLFQASGAKYVVPVFEHHDGFAMSDSGLADWTAVKMGPHRGTGGELAKAVRAEGRTWGPLHIA